jgi:hypothetical protein
VRLLAHHPGKESVEEVAYALEDNKKRAKCNRPLLTAMMKKNVRKKRKIERRFGMFILCTGF